MSVFGSPVYGGNPYGGKTSKYSPVGSTLYVYGRDEALKGVYQQGSGAYIGCEFKHDEAGANSFILRFAGYVDIIKTDYIEIYLFDSEDAFFTGVVRTVPIQGSTDQDYLYIGYGFNDYLVRITTGNVTYTGQTIEYIVEDLITGKIEPESPVVYNASKVDSLTTVVSEISFNYVSVKEALDQLKSLANADGNDYRVGVDETGEFMFKARSSDTVTLIVGAAGQYGITDYNPEDKEEATSRLYVLKKDGTFYGTYTTTEDIDIFEKKLTAPDIADADIDTWAEGQLWQLEQEERTATIQWEVEIIKPTKLMADGFVRVICNRPPTKKIISGSDYGDGDYGAGIYGGEQYTGFTLDDTLKVKEISYRITDKGAIRNIQLGSIPVTLDSEMIDQQKQIAALRVSVGT